MKQYKVKIDRPNSIYAGKHVIAENLKGLDLVLALDPNIFNSEPKPEISTPDGAIIQPKSVSRAQRYFRFIQKNAKDIPNATRHDCWRIKFPLDLDKFEHGDRLDLVFRNGDQEITAPIQITEYESLIASKRAEINALGFPTKTGTRAQFRDLYKSIDDLPSAVHDRLDAKEAMALALGAIHAKPAKTFLYLNQIRAKHEENGTIENFEKFEVDFNSIVHPKALFPHGYTSANPLNDLDPSVVAAEIEATFEFWKSHGYDCFINSGSLLGLTRDKRFIEHDDDVDIGIIMHSRKLPDVIREWTNIHDIMVSADNGHLSKGGYKIYKFKNKLGIQFDLFPAWFNEKDKFTVYPHSYQNLTREDIYPLKREETLGILTPANPEQMLISNYGAKWQTPDPLSRFNWTKANRVFAQFIHQLEDHVARIVITYGHFENFDEHDARYLQRAAELGTRLVVACADDGLNLQKNANSKRNFAQRAEILRACRYVDHVIPLSDWEQMADHIDKLNISVLALSDQHRGEFDRFKENCEVVYLPNSRQTPSAEIKYFSDARI